MPCSASPRELRLQKCTHSLNLSRSRYSADLSARCLLHAFALRVSPSSSLLQVRIKPRLRALGHQVPVTTDPHSEDDYSVDLHRVQVDTHLKLSTQDRQVYEVEYIAKCLQPQPPTRGVVRIRATRTFTPLPRCLPMLTSSSALRGCTVPIITAHEVRHIHLLASCFVMPVVFDFE